MYEKYTKERKKEKHIHTHIKNITFESRCGDDLTVYTELSLSLDNDVMATSKRCVKRFSLIFILKCLTKVNLIRV